jgi:hypothetical protein
MSVRLQGGAWMTLPPPEWVPEISLAAWVAKWVIPNDSELGSYDVRFEATNSDGSWSCDYWVKEAVKVVDDQVTNLEWGDGIAYVDRTHQSAIPVIIETVHPSVEYFVTYLNPSSIGVGPETEISDSEWSLVNSVEPVDFPVESWSHSIHLSDLDGDGKPEIIRAVLNKVEVRTIDGQDVWSYTLPAVADQMLVDDIDFDGKPEILVTTWVVGESGYGRVIVLDQAGNLKWENDVSSNAHGIAIRHPIPEGAGQVIVGTCANLVYVFSNTGILLNHKTLVTNEWSSIDSIAVGDVDGDGQDEFVLGVWRMDRVDLWVLTPTLETKWRLTLDSLGLSLGTLTVFDGIALTPAPNGGHFIWVATSPLYYNTVVDPILFQIDGRSALVVAGYHLGQYIPVKGARNLTEFITVKAANIPSRVFVKVTDRLLVFGFDGLQGIVNIPGAEVLSSSTVGRRADGSAVIAICYRSYSTGEYGVKVLTEPKLFTQWGKTFPYDAVTMQGRLVVNIYDLFGFNHTLIVDLPPYDPPPILRKIRPHSAPKGKRRNRSGYIVN